MASTLWHAENRPAIDASSRRAMARRHPRGYARRGMTVRLGVAIVSLAILAGASSADAAPLPIQGLNGILELPAAKGTMVWTLGQDCISIEGVGWKPIKSRKRNTSTFAIGTTGAVGLLDAVNRSGEVREEKDVALRFHNYSAKPDRALDVHDLGVEVRGGRAYLTGRIVKGKPTFAATKRVRLATIPKPRFFSGNATVPRHPTQTMPDTFLMAIQGNATLAAPLAAALNRIRCHPDPFFVIHPRPVRPGLRFGFVSMQLQPSAAIGTGGTAGVSPEFETDDLDVTFTSTPIAPASQNKAGIGLPIADGAHARVACVYGFRCTPAAGAQFGLSGGITVTANGHSATIDALQMRFEPGGTGESPVTVLFGNVNGQPMDLTRDSAQGETATSEFLQALSAALGVTVSRAFFGSTVTFTKLTAG